MSRVWHACHFHFLLRVFFSVGLLWYMNRRRARRSENHPFFHIFSRCFSFGGGLQIPYLLFNCKLRYSLHHPRWLNQFLPNIFQPSLLGHLNQNVLIIGLESEMLSLPLGTPGRIDYPLSSFESQFSSLAKHLQNILTSASFPFNLKVCGYMWFFKLVAEGSNHYIKSYNSVIS